MLRVALTGGVGSGKSAAAALFRSLGARVSQSDEVGRALMQPGEAVYEGIVRYFGRTVVAAEGVNGSLDRAALARIAFAEGRVEELNAIVHPAVIAAQARWMDSVAAEDACAVAIVESALVFETRYGAGGLATGDAPWRTRFDRIVVVAAATDMRRERYIRRVGGSALIAGADFDRRNAAQWTDEQRMAKTDFVLRNDGSLADLEADVERLYRVLKVEAVDASTTTM
jgi:dephospho-CoA kinase